MFHVALILALVLFPFVFWLYSQRASEAMKKIPGSLGWPIVGESFSFIAEFSSPTGVYNFIRLRQKMYGNVFKTYVLGRLTVFVTGREASKILMMGKDGMVSLNLFYTGKQLFGTNSLLQANGETHKRLRRLIGEPLSVDALKKYVTQIELMAIRMMKEWDAKTVCVLDEASNFTFKVISYMIMSLEPGPEQHNLRENFRQISSAFASVPLKIPGTAFYRGIKARDRMFSAFDLTISRRRSGEEFHDDFLQSLVTKDGDEEEEKLTDCQLKDNLLTLLAAGHDTTTAALMWAVKFLEENPESLHQLREEHMDIQRNRTGGGTNLTWTEINSMPYTIKVINETLRKASIFPWLSRVAMEDCKINGFEMKKGWAINLDVRSVHLDPELYNDPEKFDPSRFEAQVKPFSFLGFGGGPRMCPGMNLAKLEMCIFVHHFVTRYRWKALEKNNSLQPMVIATLKSRYPIAVEHLE